VKPVGARGVARSMLTMMPLLTSFPESFTIRTSKSSMGFPAEPGFTGTGLWTSLLLKSLPAAALRAMPEIEEPDSDDNQLSITWAPGAQYFSSRP